MFFDRSSGYCMIHAYRPVDCRLFPLDIKKIGDEYHWVQHNYPHCKLSEDDDARLLRYGAQALPLLEGEIEDFATVPLPGMAEVGYRSLQLLRRRKR